ncbi:MAG: conjugal transfer protein TraF [Lentisphaerae bacterium]|nr:conjugal transfer protein TraF [Lentisphaerota bacterium]
MKHKIAPVISMFACFVLYQTNIYASEFRVFGHNATAMGGTGVASSQGTLALYYNPAAVAIKGPVPRITGSIGVLWRDTGIAERLDSLADKDWNSVQMNPTAIAAEADSIKTEILAIEDSDGAMFDVGGQLAVQFGIGPAGSMAVGAFSDVQAGVAPIIDRTRINISLPSDPNSIANNETKIVFKGIALTEVPLGYAQKISFAGHQLNVGGAVKFMSATTFDGSINIEDVGDSGNLDNKLSRMDMEDNNFGVDLGVLYIAPADLLSAGLVVKNINSPSFDTVEGNTIDENMQLRAGVEAALLKRKLRASFDLDLTENETVIQGYNSRFAGIGVALAPTKGISLQGGVSKNLSETDPGIIYSLGVGLGFGVIHVNVAAMMSSKMGQFDDNSFPAEARVLLALESTF